MCFLYNHGKKGCNDTSGTTVLHDCGIPPMSTGAEQQEGQQSLPAAGPIALPSAWGVQPAFISAAPFIMKKGFRVVVYSLNTSPPKRGQRYYICL